MPIGKTIEQLRKQKGLTQAQLASQIQVHQSVITRWERQNVQPRAKILGKLAEVLGVTEEELMAGALFQQEYGRIRAALPALRGVDPDLVELFNQADKLDASEQEALKVFLRAMLARAQMQEVIAASGAGSKRRAVAS